MVDRLEIEALLKRAVAAGGTIDVERDITGWPYRITVRGLAGIGPHPMSTISAAERLREVLNGAGQYPRGMFH